MTLPTLSELARLTGAPLEDVALAIAAEFGPVRIAEAKARLDLLAAPLGNLAGEGAEVRANALCAELAGPDGFCVEGEDRASSLMLDHVLVRREGHPLTLAIVHVAVARRAGVELFPIGNDRAFLLADREIEPPLVLDPVPGGSAVTSHLHWLCPHLVALRLINAIGCRFLQRGDLANGIRAAEVRMLLPLNAATRSRHEVAMNALRARLN